MPAATMRSWAGKPDLTLTRWTSLADQPKRHQMTNFPKLTFLATVIAGLELAPGEWFYDSEKGTLVLKESHHV